jgi:hypothetical protein
MGRAGDGTARLPPPSFGDLTLVRYLGRSERGDRLARWRCTCGVTRTFPVKHVRGGRTRSWEKVDGAGAPPRDRGKYPLGDLCLFVVRLPDGRPEALARGQDRRELARRALERMLVPQTDGAVAYGVCTFGELRAILAAKADA